MGNSSNKQMECNSSSLSNSFSSRICIIHDESIDHDQFTFIWLDSNALGNSLDSLRTKTLLRQLNNNHCLFFDNVNLFLLEAEKLKNENKKILLIVSGLFAKEILSKTIDIVSTIIIFCRNSNKYNHLIKEYRNIIDICTEHEMLKHSIQRELPSLRFNLFTNQKLNSLRSLNAVENIGNNNSAHLSYMLFIDFLKQMPQTNQAKNIMLDKCKDYYRKDKPELERIELFRNTYKPNTAIDWYIKDSFAYRLVNHAFRTEDITLWYLFRYYITDLYTQLEYIHKQQNCQSFLKLYRGQSRLPTKELECLKSNINGLVSTNGFLSTSKNYFTAKSFISGTTDTEDFKVVLFEISVDSYYLKNVIFVDIDQYIGLSNEYESEYEVLFNIGSVFQIQSVNYDSDLNAWKIKLKATDEGTDSIKEHIQLIKQKFKNGNINLLFGRLLINMNEYSKAESYFRMMLNVLPKSHPDIAAVYDFIGDLNMHTTNWNEALKNFNLAYDIRKKKLHSNHQDIAVTLNNFGNYYKAIQNNNQALEYYSKVLTCKINQYNRAITLLNMGTIYTIKNNYDKALDLCIEARDIIQEISSITYTVIIQCHGIIGNIYLDQENYNAAKDFYLTAFEMSKRNLFTNDHHQIVCIKALANLYHRQNMKQQAIDFCLDQLDIYKQHLAENHINIAYLFIIIAELYEDNEEERINYLEKALGILQENIHLHYHTTANCFKLIGQYYQKQNLYSKAITFYMKALEIQKKIYPEHHFILNEAQSLIDTVEN